MKTIEQHKKERKGNRRAVINRLKNRKGIEKMNMEKLVDQSVELLAEINGESAESVKNKIAQGCKATESMVFSCSCALMAVNS